MLSFVMLKGDLARKKEYNEAEVAEKAMQLFWEKGYDNTSMRDLERHLGINQFSIYASFKSKQGLLSEAIMVYEQKINDQLLYVLEDSDGNPKDISTFFYKFIHFVQRKENLGKGCLMINTLQEIRSDNELLKKEILSFTSKISIRFKALLERSKRNGYLNDHLDTMRYVHYLMGVLQGLSTASKHSSRKELGDFIDLAVVPLHKP